MKKVILDCDPGHDDAFAMMLALKHLDVLGITVVGGNGTLENVAVNALKVLEVLQVKNKVYKGFPAPLVNTLTTAPQFHGKSGMDGPVLPEPKLAVESNHAVDFMIETALNHEKITLIATGPLTNIAGALIKEPAITAHIDEIYIMGGSVTFGNWTPTAEFNIFVDPEAAYKVFHSGVLVKMSGINLTRQCLMTAAHMQRMREMNTRASHFAADLLEYFIGSTTKSAKITGANLHDACAVAWAIDPALITAAPMHIDVELKGELTRGMTVCDYRHLRGSNPAVDLCRAATMDFRGAPPNAEAGLELNFDAFLDLLFDTLASYA